MIPELLSLTALIVVVLLSANYDRQTLKRGQAINHDLNFIRLALAGFAIYVCDILYYVVTPGEYLSHDQLILAPLMLLVAWIGKDTSMALILKRRPWYLGHTAKLDRWQIRLFDDGKEYFHLLDAQMRVPEKIKQAVIMGMKLIWFAKLALIVVLIVLMAI